MNYYRSLSLILLISVLVSTSCSKSSVQPSSSSTGALTANSALNNLGERPFDRQMLSVNGLQSMNEFIRPDIRSRLDEEPTGDTDGSFDPSTVDTAASSSDEPPAETSEPRADEQRQQHSSVAEDQHTAEGSSARKFLWVKKSFGDAIKAQPTNAGVIVLYADENYFDVNGLMSYVEEGRNLVAKKSGIETDRIQVVFGGYRATAQVELWVIPEGGPMPEFKTEARPKSED